MKTPTEQQILEAAEAAGLLPNTIRAWMPQFHRYHESLAAAQPQQAEKPATPKRCAKPSLSCPNMKDRENDTSMSYEHYDCKACGGHIALDYDDVR